MNIGTSQQLLKELRWPARRQVRLVRKAKEYIINYEGELQQRLAAKKTTRDMIAQYKLILNRVSKIRVT